MKQAGKITNDQLKSFLLPYGYIKTYTPGLWTHKTKNISFTLIVDDFGVKYTNQKYAQELMNIWTPNMKQLPHIGQELCIMK